MKQPYTVLIAEDHAIQRKMLADFCARANWSVVCTVSSSAQVISQYLQYRPDLILIDIHLDKSDGMSAIRSLKDQGHEPYVIFVTGSLDPIHQKNCGELNVVDYITKPYELSRIEEALQKVAAKIEQNE